MVYCGKPSKACVECRLRRTKCDTLKPSCSQCIRASRICAGYRNPSDSIFVDEALHMQRKRHRKADGPQTRGNAPGSTQAFPKTVAHTGTEAMHLPLVYSSSPPTTCITTALRSVKLVTSVEDQARSFFFANYIIPNQEQNYVNFQYLSDIYRSQKVGQPLGDVIVALGMAGLSNFWGASSILISANAKYNSALRLINEQLNDPEEVKSDQTLVAVMSLSLYETNTCNRPQSMKAWTKHINGALEIMYLRGTGQLECPLGRKIFEHMRRLVTTNCIQRHVSVPSKISEWSDAATYETSNESTLTALSALAIKYACIRSKLTSFHDFSNNDDIIASLQSLDAEYIDWYKTWSAQFQYETVTLEHPRPEVYSRNYHNYTCIGAATVYNNYRCVRVLLNELLANQLKHKLIQNQTSTKFPTFPLYEALVQASTAVLTLAEEICASVPFFLGQTPDFAAHSAPKAVSGNLLIWPLYIAACTGLVSNGMRTWVIGRLEVISNGLGIRQAAPLAQTLSLNQNLLQWVAGDFDQSLDFMHGFPDELEAFMGE